MDRPLLFSLLLLFGFVCFAAAQLRGPAGAVCTRQASRQVMYTVENRKKREYSSGVWDYLRTWDVFDIKKSRHPRSFVTVYATEYFTDYECCVGWNRIGDTCQADCHFPCEHGLCVETNVCECDEGWEGNQCEWDADECWHGTHDCDLENGVCINTEGSYNCTCNEGLHLINGTTCHEIPDTDECARGISGCAQNCHNTHGSYYCSCDAGYTLAADRHACTDINECATGNGGCEHFCTNVPGGRECSCRRNYRLIGEQTCRDDDMYPYGEEAGEVPRRWDFSTCTEESLPQEGFRFFGRRHHQIHICDNGIVAFDRINRPRNPTLNEFGFRKAAVLAPFLARSNASLLDNLPEADRTTIYYSFYERGDGKAATDGVLQRARDDGRSTPGYFSPTYDPVWALVVTWTRVPPDCSMYDGGVCPRDHDQLPVNDFQLAISTDGTLSYATFVYPAMKLEWVSTDEAKEGGTRKCPKSDGSVAVGGYSAGDGTGPYPYTFATNASLVYRNRDFSGQDCVGNRFPTWRDVTMRNLWRINGGNWKFALQPQDNTAVPESAVVGCSRWMRQQTVEDPTQLLGYGALPPVFSCPCSAEQAYNDPTYTVYSSQFRQSRFCARSRRRVHTRESVDSEKLILSRTCCYSYAYWWRQWTGSWRWQYVGWPWWWPLRRYRLGRDRIGGGTLLTGHAGGHLVINDQAADEQAYQSCCVGASGLRGGWYCQRFQTLRPLSAPRSPGCRNYPVSIGWTWFRWDPHFTTMDGISYTFNGLGEYVIVDVDNGLYQVQGRTALALGSSHATIISAVAITERGKLPIQTNVVGNSSLDLYINGSLADTSVFESNEEIEVGDNAVILKPSNDSLLVVFLSGVTVKVSAKKGMLAVEFSAPPEYRGKVRGLLGRWDGDSTNDFEAFNGTVFSADSTERELYAFGNSWQVTEEDGPKKSLFYYEDGEDVNTFTSVDYQPKYTDELVFSDPELETKAREICGNDTECLFDVSQTGDIEVADITVEGKEDFASQTAARDRFPPTVSGPDAVYATVNDTVTVCINASDPNNGTLVFALGEDVPATVNLVVEEDEATLTWQVTSDAPFNLRVDVFGSDNTTAQYWPAVYMCSCLHGGNCDASTDPEPASAGGETKFVQRSCTCAPGYTGGRCEEDIDACLLNFDPCFPGVGCVDLPAPAGDGTDGFRCGDCPGGYTGDGFDCQDLDECGTSADVCAHTCENYPGTFICSCDQGFELAENEVSCQDIDECALQLTNCSQQCENTAGSFNCACQDGFTLAANGMDCEPDNPCSAGSDPGCDSEFGWCISNSLGTAECVCRSGYVLSSDSVTCEDYDECSAGDHHCSQLCNNTAGGYSCYCGEGYYTDEEKDHLCLDIDECFEGTDNCTDMQVCGNDPGSFHCYCAQDAMLVGDICVLVTTTPILTTRTTTTAQTTGLITTEELTTIKITTATTTLPPTTTVTTTSVAPSTPETTTSKTSPRSTKFSTITNSPTTAITTTFPPTTGITTTTTTLAPSTSETTKPGTTNAQTTTITTTTVAPSTTKTTTAMTSPESTTLSITTDSPTTTTITTLTPTTITTTTNEAPSTVETTTKASDSFPQSTMSTTLQRTTASETTNSPTTTTITTTAAPSTTDTTKSNSSPQTTSTTDSTTLSTTNPPTTTTTQKTVVTSTNPTTAPTSSPKTTASTTSMLTTTTAQTSPRQTTKTTDATLFPTSIKPEATTSPTTPTTNALSTSASPSTTTTSPPQTTQTSSATTSPATITEPMKSTTTTTTPQSEATTSYQAPATTSPQPPNTPTRSETTELPLTEDPSALRPHEQNTLVLTITMTTEEFTAEVKMNFKHRVAEILSSHCQRQVREERECQRSDEDRTRRSPDAVIFSPTDVHIPPGYPQRSSTRGSILLAFFVIRPDSDDFVPFPVDTIKMVLQLSQPQLQLQQALGSNPITSMVPYPHYLNGATVPGATSTTPGEDNPPGNPHGDSEIPLVAVSTVAAALAIIALTIIVFVCVRKRQRVPIADVYREQAPPPYSDTPVLQYDYDDSFKRFQATGLDNPIIIKDSKV